jgi:PhnB protein
MAKVKAIPEGMHTVTPSITVDGCAEAIETWKKAFGAEELARAPDPTGKKIWHAALRIGDSTIFTNDAAPEMGNLAWKTRLWLYFDNVDSAFKRATGAGLTATMPPSDMFWGDRMGVVSDRWGNQWTLAQHVKDMSPAEMKKAQDEFVAQQAKQKR